MAARGNALHAEPAPGRIYRIPQRPHEGIIDAARWACRVAHLKMNKALDSDSPALIETRLQNLVLATERLTDMLRGD